MSVKHSVLAKDGDVSEAVSVPAGGRRFSQYLVVANPAEGHVAVPAIAHVHRSRAHCYICKSVSVLLAAHNILLHKRGFSLMSRLNCYYIEKLYKVVLRHCNFAPCAVRRNTNWLTCEEHN